MTVNPFRHDSISKINIQRVILHCGPVWGYDHPFAVMPVTTGCHSGMYASGNDIGLCSERVKPWGGDLAATREWPGASYTDLNRDGVGEYSLRKRKQ